LALNLASRYKDFTGVIAMSASNVSFQHLLGRQHFGGAISEEVPYVPAETISPSKVTIIQHLA
jgi:hypothetical protein